VLAARNRMYTFDPFLVFHERHLRGKKFLRENRSCPELFSFFTGRTTGHPASKGLSNAQNVFRTRSPSLESTP
jgi:hypothetical protein